MAMCGYIFVGIAFLIYFLPIFPANGHNYCCKYGEYEATSHTETVYVAIPISVH